VTLALTPAQNDALIREIDDAVRQDDIQDFWKRFGIAIAAAIVIGLAVFGGWLFWQDHQRKDAEATAERYSVMLARAKAGNPDDAAIASLQTASQPAYRAGTLLMTAGLKSAKNDVKGAIADYRAIAADTSLAKPYRDLALVRQTALEFDSMAPQAVIDRLKPLSEAGNPWFGSAGELSAIAYMKLGKRDLAGALFAAIAKADDVPRTIQTRAVQMASLLGVDAQIAPRPGETKDEAVNAQ
jgi:hypothetical protein